ncbi:MAG: hypothetical protein AAB293_04345 [Pseudomonadota bacterium]
MKRRLISILLIFCCLIISTFSHSSGDLDRAKNNLIVINRGDGTLSIIDTASDQVMNTLELPDSRNKSELESALLISQTNRIYVSDRANNRIVVFDADNFSLVNIITVGGGVGHILAYANDNQLWVNNETDKTLTVIDLKDSKVIATISIPIDLKAYDNKTRFLLINNEALYIALNGASQTNDLLLKLDRRTFQEIARARIDSNSHFIMSENNDHLYLANQGNNRIQILKREDLTEVTSIKTPFTSEGLWISPENQILYFVNNTHTENHSEFTFVSEAISNLSRHHTLSGAHSVINRKIYLPYSDSSEDKIAVYSISDKMPTLNLVGIISVGLNPIMTIPMQK